MKRALIITLLLLNLLAVPAVLHADGGGSGGNCGGTSICKP